MSAKEKYERETGDKELRLLSYQGKWEWYERYVRWLEKQVEKQR